MLGGFSTTTHNKYKTGRQHPLTCDVVGKFVVSSVDINECVVVNSCRTAERLFNPSNTAAGMVSSPAMALDSARSNSFCDVIDNLASLRMDQGKSSVSVRNRPIRTKSQCEQVE